MLTIDQATERVLAAVRPLRPRPVPLTEAVGLVLAESVASDLDVPPFAKSLRDGYAVRAEDLARGLRQFHVVAELFAGNCYRGTLAEGEAVRIMTGAPVPRGADAVVMVEDTTEERAEDGKALVRIVREPVAPQANVMPRGATIRAGDVVLRSGTVLGPAQVGLLAEVGKPEPLVYPRPRVALLVTGDELVDPGCRPGPGQIRNSNGPMLAAAVVRAGGLLVLAEHVPDREESLREAISRALQTADCLLLTGGVSMGKRDLVPVVLESLGVRCVFHRVHMKPGKPLWFGTYPQNQDSTVAVFGLPGNPVSTMVCFALFVRPALRRMAGHPAAPAARLPVQLASPWQLRTDRPTFWPAKLWYSKNGLMAEPLAWQGSPDLRTLAEASGFLFLPEGSHSLAAGAAAEAVVLD